MNSLISIIIPVYNKEKYITRCIQSIKKQTFQNFEIIFVDDCSSDNSMEIVNAMMKNDNRLIAAYHTTNMGPMVARQTGLKKAKGKYVMFVDSDDTLPENALEILQKTITQSKSDIVMAGFQYKGSQITERNQNKIPKVIGEFTPTEIYNYLLKGTLTHNLCFCIFDAKLMKYTYTTYTHQTNGEDLIFFYELVGNSRKIKTLNEIVYNYHLDGISSTRSPMTIEKLNQLVRVQNFKYRFLSQKGIDNTQIVASVVRIFVGWHKYRIFRNFHYNFDSELSSFFKMPTILKYISLKSIIKLFKYRLGFGLID